MGWNSGYKDFNTNYKNKGIDQLENVIKVLNDHMKNIHEEIF